MIEDELLPGLTKIIIKCKSFSKAKIHSFPPNKYAYTFLQPEGVFKMIPVEDNTADAAISPTQESRGVS